MPTVIDAVYENGVLRPLVKTDLKEHRRYRLVLEETPSPESPGDLTADPDLAAEIERRKTVLPDGRTIIRLDGLFSADLSGIPDNEDPVAEALAEWCHERAKQFDEEWPEVSQPDTEP